MCNATLGVNGTAEQHKGHRRREQRASLSGLGGRPSSVGLESASGGDQDVGSSPPAAGSQGAPFPLCLFPWIKSHAL
jgi:hypothetical protein